MARNITVGIDIGSYQIKVVVAESGRGQDHRFPAIIGTGSAESKGLRHGYIINTTDVVRSVRLAAAQAEREAGISIKKAYLSIGGVGLEEIHTNAEVIVSRADSVVSDIDLQKAVDAARESLTASQLQNRKILHSIPLKYRIDGKPVLGRPQGLTGAKFSADVLFITCLEQHHDDLIAATEEAGIEVEDVMAAPLAGALVTTTKAQKMAGCIIANIGSETVSILVYEDGIPVSLKLFPIGSMNITHDIALGLQVSLEEAEQIKRGAITGAHYPRKRLEEIIIARLSDIFDLIEAHLTSIGKNGLLPAGIILTGGGSALASIEDLARATLHLPTARGRLPVGRSDKNRVRDSSWAVAYGLCIWGFTGDEEPMGVTIVRGAGGKLFGWLKQFLP